MLYFSSGPQVCISFRSYSRTLFFSILFSLFCCSDFCLLLLLPLTTWLSSSYFVVLILTDSSSSLAGLTQGINSQQKHKFVWQIWRVWGCLLMEETGGSIVGMGWLAKLSPPPRTILLAALIPAAARASRWQIWWTTAFFSSVAKVLYPVLFWFFKFQFL